MYVHICTRMHIHICICIYIIYIHLCIYIFVRVSLRICILLDVFCAQIHYWFILQDTGFESQLLKSLQSLEEPEKEENALFCQAMAVRMKRLTPFQSAMVQAKMLQILAEVEFGACQQNMSTLQPPEQPFRTTQMSSPGQTPQFNPQLASNLQYAPNHQLAINTQLTPNPQLAPNTQLTPNPQLAPNTLLTSGSQLPTNTQLTSNMQSTSSQQQPSHSQQQVQQPQFQQQAPQFSQQCYQTYTKTYTTLGWQ